MKPFTMLAVLVFAIVAVVQLVRVLMGWAVSINGLAVPIWGSGVVFLVAAVLAVMVWRENRAPRAAA